ncbi:MAG: response regulator [Deltaproteobacteria bacterium]|nr:MAG: response regulator [Deltaproteobacteria bacterium]
MAERRDISTSSWKGAPEPRGVAEPEAKAARESDDLPFGVVGIGASAGGIDAFRSLLGALPADTGMAYVVVQHLSPDHPSFLAQTLARFTSMPVLEIQDGTRLVPDHVYVLPSNAEVLLSRGTLRLVPRPPSPGGRLPIDALFLSLARELRSRAIGVVLSGTGEDGTAGLKEIKAEGGLTFAQTSASAHFTGMPESASAAGVVDRVLPPDQIAAELTRLGRHPYMVDRPAAGEQTADDPDAIARILSLVHRHSGVDFSAYRPSTVSRRIARRMALHRIPTASEYADFAGKDPAEPRALSQDLLIHVTGFFRDPEVFEGLQRVVFPALTGNKREGPIRIWVPGCSTGEEVYSLAISLLEYFGESFLQGSEFQIFGSDLSQRAVECARAGLYPEAALRDLGEDRLERFFHRAGEERRIAKGIRDRCVFVVHDLARNPPFAKLDLISCRNVLIYFGAELHQRLVPMFHYCLNRGGFLLLGRSENLAGFAELFQAVDLEHRIFSRVGDGRHVRFPLALAKHAENPTAMFSAGHQLSRPAAQAQRHADHVLLGRFAPPGVVVNERLDVVHFRGRTGDFLEQPPGQPQTNLLKMAGGGLLVELQRALSEAKERGVAVRAEAVQIVRGDQNLTIAIEVIPLLADREAGDRYFLVIFHDPRSPAPRAPELPESELAGEARRLREELAATKQYLESMVEQHQIADDDFATVNEELIAANEELQSTNEELESAKEELQSANEELTTLNDELRSRNAELDRLANDLSNILAAVDVPVVIVDSQRRVRRFTPDTRSLVNLIPSDAGRPIDNIKFNVDVSDVDGRIADVMQSGKPREWEVRNSTGRWFRMHIRAYTSADHRLDGAILSFVDIDTLKHTVQDANRTVDIGDDLFALAGDAWDGEAVRRAVENVLAGQAPPRPFEIQLRNAAEEERTFAVTARGVTWPGGKKAALLAFEDLTEQRRLEEERTARAVAEASNRTKDLFLATLSHELRTPLTTILMQAQVLRRAGPTVPRVEHASAVIERAVTLQKRLIDDLLDVSRIVTGKLRLDQHVVDLGEIVQGAVEEARPSAEMKAVTIETTIASGLTPVYADAARMQQVVSNLLTNAIKFTARSGTVSVTLDCSAAEARITVRDTGMGVPREFIPHLFSRFSQADGSATRLHGGLGLGLAIVKHLVDLHGGTVGAESAGEGHGATFWVMVPLVETRAQAPTPSRATRAAADISGLRVLVLEDDEGTRESLAEILAVAGASVRAVATVKEGMHALSEFTPDVVLSDLAMPGEDGFSFISRVRSLPPERGGRTPAAALSALASTEDRQHALDAGFQMHLPKPVDIDVLFLALARLAATPQA